MSIDHSKQPLVPVKQPDETEKPTPWRVIISIFATLFVLVLILLGTLFSLTPLRAGCGKLV